MGLMSELSIMLERGDSLEEITDWIILINMRRNSHITQEKARSTAEYFYNEHQKYASQEIDAEHYYSQHKEE